ncbi:WD repeat-containing protein 89-like [Lucilia sericata]|uniref:WD repeat-containing protein 89-like n=1 Tax=Lucilia sericata TaxID=13632 RepID=UPI0018A856B2|nr:WD repeat-containing protein 89-like [Lucilia sericata]
MTNTANNFKDAEDVPLPSSDEESSEESCIEDDDTCTRFELEQYFQQKYRIHDETAVTLKKNYILSLDKNDSLTRLAAGLSDGSVHLFDISSERGLSYSTPDCIAPPPCIDPKNRFTICGVRFVDETPNLLLVGTTNGLVRLFDLRTPGEVGRFENNPATEAEAAAMPKNIVCFDRNSNSRVLCVGTEQHHSNVYLLFYDLRERKQMGGYFDSHQDDVTTLRFHPQNPDLLCSGSTDGLINIFDLQKTIEDDALLQTLNTESSVHKVNWHKNVYDKDIISCITHTNDFKMYECEEADLVADFDRAKITESIKRKTPANCNLIDCHNMADGGVFLLTGSNINKGEIMRSLLVQNKQLLPGVDFQGNKQIVRESVFDINSNILITAGESGIVTLWSPQNSSKSSNSNLKAKTKKSNKATPY